MPVTNHAFADKVGCNYTMASRLRSGQRKPSTAMLARICEAYKLDGSVALLMLHEDNQKKAQGQIFSAWLREKVFNADDTIAA